MLDGEYPELITNILKKSPFDLKALPHFKWGWAGNRLKLHFVCHHRSNITKFFFEMIHRWLIPGRRIDVASMLATDFHLNLQGEGVHLSIAEMTLRMEPHFPRDQIEHNLKVIETELRLGVVSVYHASRLLETHFTSPQQKNSQIQERITKLLERWPDQIDFDIFGHLQKFMVMTSEEFKTHRTAAHLSRIVAATYLFSQENLSVHVKLASVILDLPWGPKEVLGVCARLVLQPGELFEERHLMRALQNLKSGIKMTPGSSYSHEGEGVTTLYLEVEKENGDLFGAKEIRALKEALPGEMKRAVEVPLKSLFMPRNEEEILRYIVTLAGQLRFIRDLPQVILMFDEQRGGELYFTVIVVRILFPTSYSVQYLFGQSETHLTFSPDRVKRVGMVRKKNPKEATVFRVHLSSKPFIQGGATVDLFRARQSVFQELEKVLGPLRDYTGGMIAKQVELLGEVQALLGEFDPLLEKFFHSLYPATTRSILAPEQVLNWFHLWKQLLEFPEDQMKIERDQKAVYVMGLSSVIPELELSDFAESELVVAKPLGEKHRGYLFVNSDPADQQTFIVNF